MNKQSVSNFRPTSAKYFYNKYGNNGVVWDMCAGWGGRLFGFLSSNCNTYIGTEPCEKTYNGLIELKIFLEKKVKELIFITFVLKTISLIKKVLIYVLHLHHILIVKDTQKKLLNHI